MPLDFSVLMHMSLAIVSGILVITLYKLFLPFKTKIKCKRDAPNASELNQTV